MRHNYNMKYIRISLLLSLVFNLSAEEVKSENDIAEQILILNLEQNGFFLHIEPGCGRYKLKKIAHSKESSLYLVVERIGAPINELGEITNKGLVGKYVTISLAKNIVTEITVFEKLEETAKKSKL